MGLMHATHELDSRACRLFGKCIHEVLEGPLSEAQLDLATLVCLECNCQNALESLQALDAGCPSLTTGEEQ